ncbi:MAG: EamA family transporter [Oscillospiraceae bacterium]|nr:EamA family transporter [Candidatus Ruminococcus equi]
MKKLSVLLIIITGTLWGIIGIFVRHFQELSLDSLQIVLIRVGISCVIFTLFLLFYDRKLFVIKLKDLWCFLGTGVISLAMFSFSYFKAIDLASLSVAAVLLYTAPTFVMIFSVIFFKERLTLQKGISIVLAFLGCCFVAGIFSGEMNVTLYGILFGLLSGICYALYSIFSRVAIDKGYSPLTVTLYTFIFATASVLLVTDVKPIVNIVKADTNEIWICLLFAVLSCVLPYLTYTLALKNIRASTASVIASVEPVVATIVGALFFSEQIDIFGYIGIFLVLLSIVLVNINIKSKAALE